MNYEYELDFLQDVLKKCHIHNGIFPSSESIKAVIDPLFAKIIGFQSTATIEELLGSLENKTKYKLADEFKLHYIYMKLPTPGEKSVLVIGPYLSAPISQQEIWEIGERVGIPIASQKALKEYFFSVPILTGSDRVFDMIDVFCERIFDTPSFAIIEVDKKYTSSQVLTPGTEQGESIEEIEANIKVMEMRYAFENELIRSVTLGQQHKEGLLISKLNDAMFERRAADPLRNAKNYCIIMNTLLRKAAENGGVHPIYIDSASSKFALRIEMLSDVKDCSAIMREMFSSYSRLVYNHSVKHYSPIVQKTVLIINSNISSELSLNLLAKKLGISAGYLSTVFKKETGKNVLEYIKEKRIEHAMYLLSTTHLQIQTVALHCGIMDVQYFSKIFKKKTGKTPKEYRESALR